MPTLNGSETEKHLLAAFAGESQARSRYTIAAKIAKKEGYEQISGIFMETAENELEHAKMFFKQLQGGEATITAGYPAGVVGDTLAQLKSLVARHQTASAPAHLRQSDLFTQYTRVSHRIARQKPLLLIMDDLQWADTASMEVIRDIILGEDIAQRDDDPFSPRYLPIARVHRYIVQTFDPYDVKRQIG